jgi:hypothetical protein
MKRPSKTIRKSLILMVKNPVSPQGKGKKPARNRQGASGEGANYQGRKDGTD